MNLFGAVVDLGKGVVNTAMTPVDLVLDTVDPTEVGDTRIENRLVQLKTNLEDAYDKVTDK